MSHGDLCKANGIHAYPTLRLYIEGEHKSDYRGDRTVQHFTNFLATMENDHLNEAGGSQRADAGKCILKIQRRQISESLYILIF